MTDLTTRLGESTLVNPVMVASGCAGSGRELEPFLDPAELGALVTRSVTLDPRAGDEPCRTVETPSGLLVDSAPRGSGLEGFLATELPWLVQRGVRTIVSIAGTTLGEWAELARRVGDAPGVGGLEVDLAWPPESRAAYDAYQARRVLAAVRADLPRGVPVLAKVAAEPRVVVAVAEAVAEAGADAVVVGHGPPGLALDPATLRPQLGSTSGTLGGPALHPVALRCLWLGHAAVPDVPLIGCGGVRTGADALAMLAAGACAVQVGSAVLHDPATPARVLAELAAELEHRGLPGAAAAVGLAHDTTLPARYPQGDQR